MKKLGIVLLLVLSATAGIHACSGGGGGALIPAAFSDFQTSSAVIGQPTFTANLENQGGSAAANTVRYLYGNPLVDSGRLYLPDTGNNRVLVFNTIPTSNDAAADFVLGQPAMDMVSAGTGSNEMNGPETIKTYNGKLFIDDASNHRVLIFNSMPTTTQAPADIVVGQSGFGLMATGCTSTNLKYPDSIEVAAGKLIVADTQNHRVLIWNTIPSSNGEPANVVLGQNSFTTCAVNDDNQDGSADAGPTARTLNYPAGIWSDGTRLIVADSNNNRVLIWNHIPTSDFTPADHVLGQSDLTHFAANDELQTGATGTIASARTFDYPYFLDSDGTRLFVSDPSNNRVLIWDHIPTSDFARADHVLGQSNFINNKFNDDDQDGVTDWTSARTLRAPIGVAVFGNKLFVADTSNQRYLIFQAH